MANRMRCWRRSKGASGVSPAEFAGETPLAKWGLQPLPRLRTRRKLPGLAVLAARSDRLLAPVDDVRPHEVADGCAEHVDEASERPHREQQQHDQRVQLEADR